MVRVIRSLRKGHGRDPAADKKRRIDIYRVIHDSGALSFGTVGTLKAAVTISRELSIKSRLSSTSASSRKDNNLSVRFREVRTMGASNHWLRIAKNSQC